MPDDHTVAAPCIKLEYWDFHGAHPAFEAELHRLENHERLKLGWGTNESPTKGVRLEFTFEPGDLQGVHDYVTAMRGALGAVHRAVLGMMAEARAAAPAAGSPLAARELPDVDATLLAPVRS